MSVWDLSVPFRQNRENGKHREIGYSIVVLLLYFHRICVFHKEKKVHVVCTDVGAFKSAKTTSVSL